MKYIDYQQKFTGLTLTPANRKVHQVINEHVLALMMLCSLRNDGLTSSFYLYSKE